MERVLVVAPHPDDEVLGVGGTIARHACQGDEVTVVIVTRGYPPQYSEERVQGGRRNAQAAHARLGVKKTRFLDFPAAALDMVEHRELNAQLLAVIREVQPHVMYVPFSGDMHMDHQLVFHSAMVGARPNGTGQPPRAVYAYETLSETNWSAPYLTPAFTPNIFVDISDFVEMKIQALREFTVQIQPFPHERSAEALRALAMLRGSTVSRPAAEAFVLVREIR
jgi:N-acetylglucosamine malate deacetylase 1